MRTRFGSSALSLSLHEEPTEEERQAELKKQQEKKRQLEQERLLERKRELERKRDAEEQELSVMRLEKQRRAELVGK